MDKNSSRWWVHPPNCRTKVGARWSPSFPRQSLARRRARNIVQVHAHALNGSCYHVVRIGLGAIWGDHGRRRSLHFTTPTLSEKGVGIPTLVHFPKKYCNVVTRPPTMNFIPTRCDWRPKNRSCSRSYAKLVLRSPVATCRDEIHGWWSGHYIAIFFLSGCRVFKATDVPMAQKGRDSDSLTTTYLMTNEMKVAEPPEQVTQQARNTPFEKPVCHNNKRRPSFNQGRSSMICSRLN